MSHDFERRAKRLGRLHVITDETLQTRLSHAEIAAQALTGGADCIQYREKRPLLTRELVASARQIAGICLAHGASCIVDDRADVAAAVDADGVHLGRDDLDPMVAREILSDGVLIGGTANSLEEARAVFARPVDYIGVGPIFGTKSKANPAPTMGLETLRQIVAESPVPVIAIGAITPGRVADVMRAGAFGIAVLSGITCAPDPAAAAADYASRIAACMAPAEANR